MSYEKTIVCLAASRKFSGLCVAGIEVGKAGRGPWVRPISKRPHAEIQVIDWRYENGREPALLDIICITMLAPAPYGHQAENHVIDDETYWVRQGAMSWSNLAAYADSPSTLWINRDSSYHGSFDRVEEQAAANLTSSLLLIRPRQIKIEVLVPSPDYNNKRAVRAGFHYGDINYNFVVTDPVVEAFYLAQSNGIYELGQDAYFCVSLAETAWNGHYYKLVAAIITKKPL